MPDGKKTVEFFQGLNEMLPKMAAPVRELDAKVRELLAEAYIRGFQSGVEASAKGSPPTLSSVAAIEASDEVGAGAPCSAPAPAGLFR